MEKHHQSVVELLQQLNTALAQNAKSPVSGCGLSLFQERLLLHLLEWKDGPVYATDLHRESGLSRATISARLKDLRQNGYLELLSDGTDDRRKRIVLTAKTLRLEPVLREDILRCQHQLFSGISLQQSETMKLVLERMLCNLRENQEE